ncbi:MAG: PmbA/TldA family metallopeptidase, partial [Anaerolineales bacterium]
MLGSVEVRKLLERALSLSEADETEVALSASHESLTRFAHNMIHQNVAEADATLEVRAAYGLRVGMATTNDLSPLGIERAVWQANEMAQHLPENPGWPGLPEPQPLPEGVAFDERVAELSDDPESRAQPVSDICAAARVENLLASGAFSAGQFEYAVMNSHDLFAYAPGTEVELTLVVEQPEAGASA